MGVRSFIIIFHFRLNLYLLYTEIRRVFFDFDYVDKRHTERFTY